MTAMRTKGTGTYVGGRWRLKSYNGSPEIAASLKQLSELFKLKLTSKADSAPYWKKYLTAYRNYTAKKEGANSPLQERIRSLETIITQFKEEKRPAELVAMLERELADARQVPPHGIEFGQRKQTPQVQQEGPINHEKELAEALADPVVDIHHSDGPTIHPDMRPAAELIDVAGTLDDIAVRVLNSLAPKPIPKHESLRAEIDAFIEAEKLKCEKLKEQGKAGKNWFLVRQYLELWFEVCGPIRIQDITLAHYREFLAGVKGESQKYAHWSKWGKTTQSNIQQQIHSFLQNLEIEHEGLYFPFIRNAKTRIQREEGRKETWTVEQVKTALQHATGDARLMLLLGLNCGWYTGDVVELEPSQNDGTHFNKGRAKNEGKSNFVASWLIWPETAAVLAYGRPKSTLNDAFRAFRKQYGLPEHSDLRKTVSQWIEDELSVGGEQVARLFRCERAAGNHGKFYSKFTAAQRDMLDTALTFIRKKLFG